MLCFSIFWILVQFFILYYIRFLGEPQIFAYILNPNQTHLTSFDSIINSSMEILNKLKELDQRYYWYYLHADPN